MATRNTFQDDSTSAHAGTEDALGLQELLDQATVILTEGDVSRARHLVELANLLYQEPRLEPILDGLVQREIRERTLSEVVPADTGVIGTTKRESCHVSAEPNWVWSIGTTIEDPKAGLRWTFSGRLF